MTLSAAHFKFNEAECDFIFALSRFFQILTQHRMGFATITFVLQSRLWQQLQAGNTMSSNGSLQQLAENWRYHGGRPHSLALFVIGATIVWSAVLGSTVWSTRG